MCTAISYKTKDHYFGRNLDYEFSYNETVTITPRNYVFKFAHELDINSHYAMIGMAYVVEDYPLYYDATNEKGLSMAALNFPDSAVYHSFRFGMNNIAPHEFIPWILTRCANISEVRKLLSNTNIVLQDFNSSLPATPLHWMICDEDESIVVESVKDGLKVHDDPVGVLTNNPPFELQLFNLNNYLSLDCREPTNTFSSSLNLKAYSRGMGALGLPGDLSSQSRYIKAAFTKLNSISGDSESESVSQFFHILGSVEQQRGCVRLEGGNEITIYSSCCNTTKGNYYYKTYNNSCLNAVDINRENLDTVDLITYALVKDMQISFQN